MTPGPEALPSLLPSELLSHIIDHGAFFTTLIICQKREEFIDCLVSDVSTNLLNQKLPTQYNLNQSITSSLSEEESENEGFRNEEFERGNLLLIPTLKQVAIAQHIHVVFIPTITHLRAYLATFPSITQANPSSLLDVEKIPTGINIHRKAPLLFVYGLVNLHNDTCEWSAQGLSNTLAGLIEAGQRSSRKVVVAEDWQRTKFLEVNDELNADTGDTSRERVWEIRVPILHTRSKKLGHQSEGQPWAGRTTEIGRIYARWFKFGARKN